MGHNCLIGEDAQISVQLKPKKTVFVDFAFDSLIIAVDYNLDWSEEISQTAFIAKSEEEIGAARKFMIDLSEQDRCKEAQFGRTQFI